MGAEWLAILMFVGFFFLLLSGYPVAFSFAGTAIVFGLLGLSVHAFDLALLRLLPNRWFGTMSDFTLLAIPYFVFLGAVLEKSGLAEDLLETIGFVLGPLRGGHGAGGDHRRHAAGSDDGRRRRHGDRHGHDVAAGHAPLWL